MEAWLEHLITQSAAYALIAVALVAFLESLALVGLILPGTVMMATLGAFIGGGQMDFYSAWVAGIIGCLLGDWISYFIGRAFKAPLHRWSFLQRNRALLDKTEHALHRHSMATILIGRFIGPTRPLVPMVAGMLDLPPRKFLPPNIIGCLCWPPLYFFPGILAGVAIDIPSGSGSALFKWGLLLAALLLWCACWLCWRWWREGKRSPDRLARWLTPLRLRVGAVGLWIGALAVLVWLYAQPLMAIYLRLLWRVVSV
ncbi:DedA family protein [Enterobacillus tribolii]|uniref:Membrane protein DedA with SNARE-associated domain n=1 Tax=Enterobacillus tribolii TaxID=1487935 RepID=A0A370QPY3_9GAMM|nr:DedA family protein [Enterobacillus tribolii]MBW7981471.1 DedA family protein [Enterobacillus tribolii]RDK90848.1 membrane protein DedA with SNARE-associated domain [Enterobacillus tribolii]